MRKTVKSILLASLFLAFVTSSLEAGGGGEKKSPGSLGAFPLLFMADENHDFRVTFDSALTRVVFVDLKSTGEIEVRNIEVPASLISAIFALPAEAPARAADLVKLIKTDDGVLMLITVRDIETAASLDGSVDFGLNDKTQIELLIGLHNSTLIDSTNGSDRRSISPSRGEGLTGPGTGPSWATRTRATFSVTSEKQWTQGRGNPTSIPAQHASILRLA